MYHKSETVTCDICTIPLQLAGPHRLLEVPMSAEEQTYLRAELEKQAKAAYGDFSNKPFMGTIINVPNVLRLHVCEPCLNRALPGLARIRAQMITAIVNQNKQRREDLVEARQGR